MLNSSDITSKIHIIAMFVIVSFLHQINNISTVYYSDYTVICQNGPDNTADIERVHWKIGIYRIMILKYHQNSALCVCVCACVKRILTSSKCMVQEFKKKVKYILRNTNWNSFGSVKIEDVTGNLIINSVVGSQ